MIPTIGTMVSVFNTLWIIQKVEKCVGFELTILQTLF